MANAVKILKYATDEHLGRFVIRGVISPESYPLLKIGPYQREVLPQSSIEELIGAVEQGLAPDVELGCRSDDFHERDGFLLIKGDIYIVDGLQRKSAGEELIKQGKIPHIGALIHFNTTEEWERERFRVLNANRTRLSPNIHIRNDRYKSAVVDMLYTLSTGTTKSLLKDRVSWNQRGKRGEFFSAMTLCRVTGALHSHFGPGMFSSFKDATPALEKCSVQVGVGIMKDNLNTFFQVIDECWGFKNITHTDLNPQIKSGFMATLARLFADHENFWDGKRLRLLAPERKKLALFKLTAPGVSQLTGSTGQSLDILYELLTKHFNSGKRTNQLRRWGSYREPVDTTATEQANTKAATAV